ncbi:hypothetical protein ESB00_09635 [Oleiharenicola lentus]|uniref:Transposase IS200-like domain-containing protein n=1 Tax=Oleiharenicola lentus TaxID=2508720 RepID=A0A4Q1CB44_9BACT|nr:transposase [Oleiharenicola lentus]RXK56112.1 hypothetical protein ESB00_09635 [Oleiharenicola lentus]
MIDNGGSVSAPTASMHEPNDSFVQPSRQHPAHLPPRIQGNRSTIIFLTVCTKGRRPCLANPELHQCLVTAWSDATHWQVGRYVIMPDHIHLFCAPGQFSPTPLGSWIRFWKTAVSKSIKASAGTLWQADHWDTQLRQHESNDAKWEYVRQNPVRAGLANHPDEWPFQGELNLLRWHD